MDNNDQAALFLAMNSNKFHAHHFQQIKSKLEYLDSNQLSMLQALELKDPSNMMIFSILLGSFGVDRFMLDDVGLGVVKLLTCGGCYIWTIIDWFQIQDMTKDYNYQQLAKVLL